MLALLCCRRRPREHKVADAEGQPVCVEASTSKPGSGAEQRILRPKPGDIGVQQLVRSPSRSLLEASARRLALTDREPKRSSTDRADGDVPMKFMHAYMAALRDSNTKWTADPSVADLFDGNVKMVTQDKQTFHGKAAVLRRLDKGVETLVKMAGKDAELPTYELIGPFVTSNGTSQMECTIKRGKNTYRFKLEFTLARGNILLLRNSRG